MNRKNYLYLLLLLLGIKALALILFIQFGFIGLGPDEAQYWTWSQQLAWGYYSKPPAIAWQIWMGTQLFGNSELGVRFVSLLISSALSITIFYTALEANLTALTAFWAAAAFAFSPSGILSALFAITDGGLVLCWAVACLIILRAISQNRLPHYPLLGCVILIGALFKWPIYFFWPMLVAFGLFYRFLLHPSMLVGVLISLLGLFPSVVWNASHDWVTFKHLFSTISVPESHTENRGNFLEFLGSQAALISPILFVLFVCSLIYQIGKARTTALNFLSWSTLSVLGVFTVMSLFKKIQGNWADFAYPSAFILISWYCCETLKKSTWIKAGVGLSLILCLAIFSIPWVQSTNQLAIPYKINPFKHNLGWSQLTQALVQAGYDPKQHFLFSDKYQTSSILSFYGPGQQRAYFLNLHGIRKNQFCFWPGMPEEQLGKSGFFVLTENMPHLERQFDNSLEFYQKNLLDYFEKVEYFGIFPLFESHHQLSKGALIFKCSKYNGKLPNSVDLY